MNRWQALRFVQTLTRQGFAAEDKLEDQKVCRIFYPDTQVVKTSSRSDDDYE